MADFFFTNDIFKCFFVNEKRWTLIQISLEFVSPGPIDNMSALIWAMAWRETCDKPLPELLAYFSNVITGLQWVNQLNGRSGTWLWFWMSNFQTHFSDWYCWGQNLAQFRTTVHKNQPELWRHEDLHACVRCIFYKYRSSHTKIKHCIRKWID